MKNLLVVMLFLLAICSKHVTAADGFSLASIEWILGEWKTEGKGRVITETWTKASANTFEGIGETHNKSTQSVVDSEALRLVEMAGEIFYIAKVAHNELPIVFRLVSAENKSILFENKTHDFPQRILYTLVDNHLMHVTVSNQERSFDIQFTRIK